jgi:hypothetical protein
MRVGSTEMEAGALTVDNVPIAYVVESACVGGTGEHCDGGTVLYTGTSPGFNDLDEDDPNQPIYVLPEGIEISIELTGIEAGASVMVSGVVLDEVGETAVVNSTGHLHNHPTWQIAAPGGTHPEDRQISFRLHAEGFDSSEVITVTLSLFEDEHPHESTPTPTATATATATEGHHGPPHSIMRVGSTEDGSGTLTVDEVPIAYVAESACVGGTGENCDGGTVLYTGTSPGFNDLEEADPNQPIYVLPEGIDISVELTAVAEGTSVQVSGVLLDEVGEMAVVNMTGHLHNHPTWQIAAPGGEHPADREISFVLHADGFDSSEPITVTLSLFEGEEGGEHGHD